MLDDVMRVVCVVVCVCCQELERMLELAIDENESEPPVLTHYYAVAMDGSVNGTSAISAGDGNISAFSSHINHGFTLVF